jgi:hypothetical protein
MMSSDVSEPEQRITSYRRCDSFRIDLALTMSCVNCSLGMVWSSSLMDIVVIASLACAGSRFGRPNRVLVTGDAALNDDDGGLLFKYSARPELPFMCCVTFIAIEIDTKHTL